MGMELAIRKLEVRGDDLEEDRAKADRPTPAEDLVSVQLFDDEPEKVAKIGSQISDFVKEQIKLCLRNNRSVFAWGPEM